MTVTWTAPVDLDNCATEPIHVPGAIQPHGVLLAVTEPGLRVAVVSANVGEWFGIRPAEAIGADLVDVLGRPGRDAIDAARTTDWVQRRDDVALVYDGRPYVATLHRSSDLLVVEIEPVRADDALAPSIVRETAMALQAATSVTEVAVQAARWVRSLSGFDRVMVYRFDGEWNGEVIAEERRNDLNSFLGLHYPSTDIPAQARELYRRNWLRLIPDIGYRPVRLEPAVAFDSARPLDLSTSTLRSVSPIHVEYLQNMGVTASMSVSIVVDGQLWGLIACHHYDGPHPVGVAARNAAEFLAQLISLRIGETVEADVRRRTADLVALADQAVDGFQSPLAPDVADVVVAHGDAVIGLARATGAIVVTRDERVRVGEVPPDDVVDVIVADWPSNEPFLTVEQLRTPTPTAAGALAVPLTDDRREVVVWFRPELVRQVDWGGDPHNAKLYATEGDHVRLSPRKSFDRWRETVRGRAEPWEVPDLTAATRFARRLTAALLRRQRYDAQIVADLQRVMRPTSAPSVPGWTIDVHDVPAGSGEIGGDWFDVFEAREGVIAAVVGDVAGHGLRAAGEMAQLRNSLRAYLVDDPAPAAALERLDQLMARILPGTMATAVVAVVDVAAATACVSHAGHLPALVAGPSGATYLDTQGDPLLGVAPGPRHEAGIDLAPGEALVLYSDGLLEQRQRSIDDGLARLAAVAPAALGDPEGTGPAAWLAAACQDQPEDDTSVLVLRRG